MWREGWEGGRREGREGRNQNVCVKREGNEDVCGNMLACV